MSDTVIASAIGVAGVFAGSVVTWLGTRGRTRQDGALSSAQLDEQQRQSDITFLLTNYKEDAKERREEVHDLKEELRQVKEQLGAMNEKEHAYLTERAQLRGEVGRLLRRVEELERHEARGGEA